MDQGLGELDPLLHAGGVAAHRPVALLVEPDVTQRRRRRARGRPCARQARHPCQVDDELGGAHVRRQAVVLGHVADARGSAAPAWRRRGRAPSPCRTSGNEQAQEDLDQGRLTGTVRADQTHHTGRDVDAEVRQRGDGAEAPRQRSRREEGHAASVVTDRAERSGASPRIPARGGLREHGGYPLTRSSARAQAPRSGDGSNRVRRTETRTTSRIAASPPDSAPVAPAWTR